MCVCVCVFACVCVHLNVFYSGRELPNFRLLYIIPGKKRVRNVSHAPRMQNGLQDESVRVMSYGR